MERAGRPDAQVRVIENVEHMQMVLEALSEEEREGVYTVRSASVFPRGGDCQGPRLRVPHLLGDEHQRLGPVAD